MHDKRLHLSVPEPDSLHDILRRHCTQRLYRRPIYWTATHLSLLQCAFVTKALPQPEEGSDQTSAYDPTDPTYIQAVRAIRALRGVLSPLGRINWVEDMLLACGLESTQFPHRVGFHFNNRVYELRTDGVYGFAATPSLGFVDLSEVSKYRADRVRPKILLPDGTSQKLRPNIPVYSRFLKRLAGLKPDREMEDPYIMAILIALAQNQRRLRKPSAPASEGPLKVHVLAWTFSSEDEQISRGMTLCSAEITPAFLDKFQEPFKASPSGPVSISCYRISFERATKVVQQLLRGLHAKDS